MIRLARPSRDEKIRILHVTGLAHAGSAEHILALVRNCCRRRFEQTVVMSPGSPMQADFEREGVRVLPVGIDHRGGLTRNVAAFWQLAQVIRRERCDIVHTHTSVAAALGRVATKLAGRARTLHMLHNYGSHDHVAGMKRRMFLAVERTLDRFTDYYVAGSCAMLQRGVQMQIFSQDKAVHVYNGIDTDRLDRRASECQCTIRDELKLGSDAVLVGFLGRLERQKGCELLVRAAPQILAQQRNMHFVIAGDGSLRPGLQRLANELKVADKFAFLGWRSDIIPVLTGVDLVAVPSLWEPFGLSAAEAMYLRQPVVAARVDGLPEVVQDGVTGHLVESQNVHQLAAAISSLAADPVARHAMGTAGRQRVQRLFTVRTMVEAHENLYEQISGGSRLSS